MFPTRNNNSWKGASGQSFFQYFVNTELKCVYHPINQENDYGLDGYIELVFDNCVSGKLIGVQIKHGDSYFRTATDYGYKYVGENKHLNYYLNSQSPIFIVMLDEKFERLHWVQFDVAKTMPTTPSSWWIEVPNDNQLRTNFGAAILKATTPIIDYEKEIQKNWRINKKIVNSDFRVIAIPKEEIVAMDFSFINDFLKRLTTNKSMLIKSRNSLDIFFPDYDDDPREISQIPEIMKWLKRSIEIGIPWFYFLETTHLIAGMHLLINSYCTPVEITKKANGYIVNYCGSDLANYVEKSFINMNIFMESQIADSDDLNKEISANIFSYLKRYLS